VVSTLFRGFETVTARRQRQKPKGMFMAHTNVANGFSIERQQHGDASVQCKVQFTNSSGAERGKTRNSLCEGRFSPCQPQRLPWRSGPCQPPPGQRTAAQNTHITTRRSEQRHDHLAFLSFSDISPHKRPSSRPMSVNAKSAHTQQNAVRTMKGYTRVAWP
jgi:hypothetical protein